MNITEYEPTAIESAAVAVTATGLTPGVSLSDEMAGAILAYCQTVASSAIWTAADVGLWKRSQLRQLYGFGTAAYNEKIHLLYDELSRYCPSVASPTSWRSYIQVAASVPYQMRVIGYGPSIYSNFLSFSPAAFAAFVQAVQDGNHEEFRNQLLSRPNRATHIAQMETDESQEDDAPFSGSGHNFTNGANHVNEYEQSSAALPVLTWESLADVRALRDSVLVNDWEQARAWAEKVRWM